MPAPDSLKKMRTEILKSSQSSKNNNSKEGSNQQAASFGQDQGNYMKNEQMSNRSFSKMFVQEPYSE